MDTAVYDALTETALQIELQSGRIHSLPILKALANQQWSACHHEQQNQGRFEPYELKDLH
jgi:hypothetical protein